MSIRNLASILVLSLLGVFSGTFAPSHRERCRANEVDWRERYRYRIFVYDSRSLANDTDLTNARQLLQQAGIAGYNCCILGTSTDLIQPQSVGPEFLNQLRVLREEADRQGIALVPAVFPFDSDHLVSPLAPHLAEGLPVRDVACIVIGDRGYLRPDPVISLVNPGFETDRQAGVLGWQVSEARPGQSIKVDTSQAKYGNSSLRFGTAGVNAGVVGYQVAQKIWLPPFRLFRLSVWVRSGDDLKDTRARLAVRSRDRYVANEYCDSIETREWGRHGLVFNSVYGGETELSLSVIGGKSDAHEIWFDNVELEHVGLANVLRRPGCPIVVRNERGRKYQEKQDFEIVEMQTGDQHTAGDSDVDAPLLSLTKDSRIRSGERLRVSFYSRTCYGVASLCTTSELTYEFFSAGITPLQKQLAPFGYHLATKYITTANWDETCQRCKGTLGAQWSDGLQRQAKILRSDGSRPVCFVWSDMYEPWNDPYSRYWLRNGSFEDAWQQLPRNFIVLNARYNIEGNKSPRFFAANGYGQVIAGDGKVGEWIHANTNIRGVVGVMNVNAPLEEFAEKAWGWLPQEIRGDLPSAPESGRRHHDDENRATAENSPCRASKSKMRTWADASGQHTVEAAFVNVKESIVTLLRRDGSEITVPLKALSDDDRRWVVREATSRNVD